MSQGLKFICWAGVIAALGFCVVDVITSVKGIRDVVGVKDDDFIAVCIPIFFAVLALCFNGLSSHFFRLFARESFSSFSTAVTLILWIFFLAYDWLSSLIGLLNTFSRVHVTDWATMMQAVNQLGALASFFVIVMAFLASLGPFLLTLFYELATSPGRSN